MTTATAAAHYLLTKTEEPYSVWSLHRLLFLARVWAKLRSYDLFDDAIEAWATGPVVRSVQDLYRSQDGWQMATADQFPEGDLIDQEINLLDRVWSCYGHWDRDALDKYTSTHPLCTQARKGLADLERGQRAIDFSSL